MKHNDLQKHHFLFILLITIICVMSLLSRDSLNGVYLYFSHLFSINPVWVSGDNATNLSNAGHIIACFMLTLVAFHVFQENYVKAILFVTCLACLGEFSQSFSMTRQAKLEDILFSLCGILLTSPIIAFLKNSILASQPNK